MSAPTSVIITHCTVCDAGRTFQLGYCVACGYELVSREQQVERLTRRFWNEDHTRQPGNCRLAAEHVVGFLGYDHIDAMREYHAGGEAA